MRRTLTVVAVTAAMLIPAGAASATTHENASCNNGKGGNLSQTGHGDNGNGNSAGRSACDGTGIPPVSGGDSGSYS